MFKTELVNYRRTTAGVLSAGQVTFVDVGVLCKGGDVCVRATNVVNQDMLPKIVPNEEQPHTSAGGEGQEKGGKGKGKGKKGGRKKCKCHSCGGRGHTSAQCASRNLHSFDEGLKSGSKHPA